jgi:hypothetical protein
MNKLFICVISLIVSFQVCGMEKQIVPDAQYYGIFDFQKQEIKIRKALGVTTIPFKEYRGTLPNNADKANHKVAFFNGKGELLVDGLEKVENDNTTKILISLMRKLDPRASKPVAQFARVFECEEHGQAIKLFDAKYFELGCFSCNHYPIDLTKIKTNKRITQYIDVSQLQARSIQIDDAYSEDCLSIKDDCTIL